MSKLSRIAAAGLLALAGAAPAPASDMLNAPSWQLDYEVTFKAAHADTATGFHGLTHYDIALESTFKTGLALDMRSDGGTLSMLKMSMATQGGATMSAAEQQRLQMEVIQSVGTTATWTIGGAMAGENPTPEAMQEAMGLMTQGSPGTATVNYSYVVTGKDLVEESGSHYDLDSRTTITGSGRVYVPANLNFELNTKTKRFILSLAHECTDTSGSQAMKVTAVREVWAATAPTEKHDTGQVSLVVPARIIVDEPGSLMGAVLAVDGDFDPAAGKISGQRTVKAHYEERGTSVPGTLTVSYTLVPRK